MSEVFVPWQRDNSSGSDSHQVRTRDFAPTAKVNTGADRSGVSLFATAGRLRRPGLRHSTAWRVKHDACRKTPRFRIMLEETQKAPSTIAPTKANAAHTASTLSFIVTFTRRTSITIADGQRSRKREVAEVSRMLQCRNACVHDTAFPCARAQHHEIDWQIRNNRKVPDKKLNFVAVRPYVTAV
jgi:hypothetical protein